MNVATRQPNARGSGINDGKGDIGHPQHTDTVAHNTCAGDIREIHGCTTDAELDQILLDAIDLPARTFFDVATQRIHVEQVHARINSIVQLKGLCRLVIHVRHHWVAGIAYPHLLTVYDSATSQVVLKDLMKLAHQLGRSLEMPACPQQIRGSNECGLFCAAFLLLHRRGTPIPNCTQKTSLAELRSCRRIDGANLLAIAEKAFKLRITSSDSMDKKDREQLNTVYRHDPYATKSTVYLHNLHAATTPHVDCYHITGGTPKGEVTDVDASEEVQHLLADTYSAEARLHEALREKSPGESITTDTLDTLLTHMLQRALKLYPALPIILSSSLNTKPTNHKKIPHQGTFTILRPIYHHGHFVLLTIRCRDGKIIEAIVRDSVQKYYKKELDEIVFGICGIAPLTIFTGHQAANDCAFHTLRNAVKVINEEIRVFTGDPRVSFASEQECSRQQAMASTILLREAQLKLTRETLDTYLGSERTSRDGTKQPPASHDIVSHSKDERIGNANTGTAIPVPTTRPQRQNQRRICATCRSSLALDEVCRLCPKSDNNKDHVSHGSIRKLMKTLEVNDALIVTWSTGEEAGTWCGTMQNGKIDFVAYLCPHCQKWVKLDGFSNMNIPLKQVTYHRVERTRHLSQIHEACDCEDDLEGDTEAPMLVSVTLPTAPHTKANAKTEQRTKNEKSSDQVRSLFLNELGKQGDTHISLSSSEPKASRARYWHIYENRPPHVHVLVWKRLAATTRATHRRWLNALRTLPAYTQDASMSSAAVDMVIELARARKWRWSTVSAALSSIASALAALPLYSNEKAIDLRSDPYFRSAMQRAQHLAKVSHPIAPPNAALPKEAHQRMLDDTRLRGNPSAKLFLELLWIYAARPADLRLVLKDEVTIDKEDNSLTVLTFRRGKGAAFNGPFSLAAHTTPEISKAISAHLQSLNSGADFFSSADQTLVSMVTRDQGFNLRAVRKGALDYLAQIGASDDMIQLRGGHSRRDTTLRYLGWGANSSSQRAAAQQIRDLIARQSEPSPKGGNARLEAPKMGPFSGKCGLSGQRTTPGQFKLPKRPPSHKDLGLLNPAEVAQWPLHVKNVDTCDKEAILKLAQGTEFGALVHEAWEWLEDAGKYNIPLSRTFTSEEIPHGKFTSADIECMKQGRKIAKYRGPIYGYCKAFWVPQGKKKVRRPIFEPIMNNFIHKDRLPNIRYPSRAERRSEIKNLPYRADVDFAGFFDQFEIPPEMQKYFIVKLRDEHGHEELYSLTRLPMGSVFSPGLAQLVTWTLTNIVHQRFPGICIHTMIDNTRFGARSRAQLKSALEFFFQLANKCKIQFTEVYDINKMIREADGPQTFLGETFHGRTVRNSAANVEKLDKAMHRLRLFQKHELDGTYTIRNFSALMGLLFFLAHTINVNLVNHFQLRRGHSRILSRIQGQTKSSWDQELQYVDASFFRAIERLAAPILTNSPVEIPDLLPPGGDSDYDVICVVDACGSGWAAFVHNKGTNSNFTLQQKWQGKMAHSAHSEPTAVTRLLSVLNADLPHHLTTRTRIAIVTDHEAIVNGFKEWDTLCRGISLSYPLNACFAACSERNDISVDMFYVEGQRNIADGMSREAATLKHGGIDRQTTTMDMPSLEATEHPRRLCTTTSRRALYQI